MAAKITMKAPPKAHAIRNVLEAKRREHSPLPGRIAELRDAKAAAVDDGEHGRLDRELAAVEREERALSERIAQLQALLPAAEKAEKREELLARRAELEKQGDRLAEEVYRRLPALQEEYASLLRRLKDDRHACEVLSHQLRDVGEPSLSWSFWRLCQRRGLEGGDPTDATIPKLGFRFRMAWPEPLKW